MVARMRRPQPVLAMAVLLTASTPLAAGAVDLGSTTSTALRLSPGAASQRRLDAVAATSASSAWAVGSEISGAGGVSRTLVEHWDGARWSIVASPNVKGMTVNALDGVAVAAPDDAWAVGSSYSDPTPTLPMILHWDGRAWKLVRAPHLGVHGRPSTLSGITALSGDDVWAVGTVVVDGTIETLVVHWDGQRWKRIASPNPGGSAGSDLRSVFATSATDVWSVGHVGGGSGVAERTLVEHWDGQRWRHVRSPNMSLDTELVGVSAASPDDAWAVGSSYDGTQTVVLIEHWDGRHWRITSTCGSSGGSVAGSLEAVSATSSADAWAVGAGSALLGKTLIERWDGKGWRVVRSPSPPRAEESELLGVSAVSGDVALATGAYVAGDPPGYRVLTERWDGSAWRRR